MKMRGCVKFSNDFPIADAFKMMPVREYKKGYLDADFTIMHKGQLNDDFIRDISAIVFKFNRYKIPRIFNRRKIINRNT